MFTPSHYDEIRIEENAASGTSVVQLTANDGDEPNTPQSTLTYYLKADTGRGLFQVDEDTGSVSINRNPDFEELHQITVGVSR